MTSEAHGMTMTEMAVNSLIYHLKQGPMTCTQAGSALWGKRGGGRRLQAYARPGGRILHHMKRLGLVERYFDGRHFYLWRLVTGWEKKLHDSQEKRATE